MGIPRIGTEIKIINAGTGAIGCNGEIGTVTNEMSSNGIWDADAGYNVRLKNGEIWRINENANIEILRIVIQ